MRLLNRNLQTIYYCLYTGKEALTDDNGFKTGEYKLTYDEPVSLKCSVSPATGSAQSEIFGNLESYDKVIITDNIDCAIDENTLLFVDKDVEYDSDNNLLADYTVKRIAKSLNTISYAVSKVTIS